MASGLLSPVSLWRLARKVEGLFENQTKQAGAIEAAQIQLAILSDRVARLETREEVIIVKAESAARGAAMGSATAAMADLARRIGSLEERGRLDGGVSRTVEP